MSKIIDTECYEEITKHVSDDALILFDLDNTLIEPLQHFGSVQWGEYYEKKLLADGKSPEEAEKFIQTYWNECLIDIPMRLLDESAPEYIRKFRLKGHVVLGLTARYHEDAIYTLPQLDRFGIQFDRRYQDQKLSLRYPALFEHGVMYASLFNTKSETLLALLKAVNYFPKKVIFVDDKLHHVMELYGPLKDLDIEYVGIRYSKADKRVQEFDSKIADLQMKLFPKFVSDEEAKLLLKTKDIKGPM